MKSRWLLNLALLVAVVALGALYVYHRDEQKTRGGPPLTAIAPDSITRLRLERPGRPDIALQRKDGAWRMTEPLAARASRFNAETLLRVAGARSELALAAAADGLAQYGLAAPQVRLRLDDEVIAFGSLHPFRHQVYVLYRNEVHLIPGQALGAVNRGYSHFLDGRLLEEDARLTALNLPGFTLRLEDGAWRRQPPDRTLGADRLSEFVAQWSNAYALSVERYGGRPALAAIRLTVARGEQKPKTLALGILQYKPEFVLWRQDEGLQYHFPEETGKKLLRLRES